MNPIQDFKNFPDLPMCYRLSQFEVLRVNCEMFRESDKSVNEAFEDANMRMNFHGYGRFCKRRRHEETFHNQYSELYVHKYTETFRYVYHRYEPIGRFFRRRCVFNKRFVVQQETI